LEEESRRRTSTDTGNSLNAPTEVVKQIIINMYVLLDIFISFTAKTLLQLAPYYRSTMHVFPEVVKLISTSEAGVEVEVTIAA
jgi:hypothetical protein